MLLGMDTTTPDNGGHRVTQHNRLPASKPPKRYPVQMFWRDTDEVHQQIHAAAAERGVHQSEVVRDVIRAGILAGGLDGAHLPNKELGR
jgi:hypothetical protein